MVVTGGRVVCVVLAAAQPCSSAAIRAEPAHRGYGSVATVLVAATVDADSRTAWSGWRTGWRTVRAAIRTLCCRGSCEDLRDPRGRRRSAARRPYGDRGGAQPTRGGPVLAGGRAAVPPGVAVERTGQAADIDSTVRTPRDARSVELGVAVAEGDLSDDDRELLARLAGTAGLALANVRLTYDLRRELAESTELARRLDQSRQRLLDAAAQQTERFVATVDQQVQSRLDRVDLALDAAAEGDIGGLADAHREATAALAALRELAAGVFPPALADRGLRHAVEMYCVRFDGRVKIRSLPMSARGPLAIEAAAYFCVVQLVDDCVTAGPVTLTLDQDGGGAEDEIQTSQAPAPTRPSWSRTGSRRPAVTWSRPLRRRAGVPRVRWSSPEAGATP